MEFVGETFGFLGLIQKTLTLLIELFVVWTNILEMIDDMAKSVPLIIKRMIKIKRILCDRVSYEF